MGIRRTIREIEENIGNNTADYLDKLGNETKNFSCQLWKQFPNFITNGSVPGTSFARGFMSNICQDDLPPPPNDPGFVGGQCPGVTYRINFTLTITNITNCNVIGPSPNQVDVTGPIEGFRFIQNGGIFTSNCLNPGGPAILGGFNVDHAGTTTVMTAGHFGTAPNIPGFEAGLSSIELISIIRLDGLPDDCGNPPSGYPDVTPQPPDLVTNININLEDGTTQNFTLQYNPTNITFPMIFNLNDLDLTLDIGGLDFNFGPINFDLNPPPLPDGQPSPLPPPRDDRNRRTICLPTPTPDDVQFDEEEKTPQDPKEEDVGERLRFVRVTLSNIPVNAKSQWGDGAPDIVYAGWFEFQSETFNYPRRPIHFQQCIFDAPEGATGYAYTLYQGFEGFATIYQIK